MSLGGTGYMLAGDSSPKRRGGWRRRVTASFGCGSGDRLLRLSGLILLKTLVLGFVGLLLILLSFFINLCDQIL